MSRVIVRLTGGLGNQMFQYAAGLAHAKRTGADLVLDLSRCGLTPDRPFHLRGFRVDEPEAQAAEIQALEGGNARWRRRVVQHAPWAHGLVARGRYQQPDFRFDASLAQFKPPLLMTGDFQSEQFFAHERQAVLDRFRLGRPLPDRAQGFSQQITSAPAPVAVHVRRGDYLTNTAAHSLHGVCPVDYYREAVEVMRAKIGTELSFFVFSDEPEWVRATFNFLAPMEVIDGHAETPWLDIHLMSLCRGIITANSSFSWWGGWLGEHPQKVVVCPAKWVRHDNGGKLDTADLQPKSWIKIQNELV
ncbi:MAG: hypothetical protein RL291_1371 [Pseudomonadota bacterium]